MIRSITSADKEIYFSLANEFYHSDAVLHSVPKKFIENTFCEMMRSTDYTEGFIIEHENEIAGYGLISKSFSQESGGNVIWLEELYIKEQFRGLGLGSAYFDFIESKYKATRYRLEVEPENERAVKLYKRRGYEFLPYNQMIKEQNQYD